MLFVDQYMSILSTHSILHSINIANINTNMCIISKSHEQYANQNIAVQALKRINLCEAMTLSVFSIQISPSLIKIYVTSARYD